MLAFLEHKPKKWPKKTLRLHANLVFCTLSIYWCPVLSSSITHSKAWDHDNDKETCGNYDNKEALSGNYDDQETYDHHHQETYDHHHQENYDHHREPRQGVLWGQAGWSLRQRQRPVHVFLMRWWPYLSHALPANSGLQRLLQMLWLAMRWRISILKPKDSQIHF